MRTAITKILLLTVIGGSAAFAVETAPTGLAGQIAKDKAAVAADARALEEAYKKASADEKAKASKEVMEHDRAAVTAALAKLKADQAQLAKDLALAATGDHPTTGGNSPATELATQIAKDKAALAADARALEEACKRVSADEKAKASKEAMERDRAAVTAALAKVKADQAQLAKDLALAAYLAGKHPA